MWVYRLDVVCAYEYTAVGLKLLWSCCRIDMIFFFFENVSLSFDPCFHASYSFPVFTELSIPAMFLIYGYKAPLETHNLTKKLPSRISLPLCRGGADT
jgi:hypothetical protein